MNLVLIGSFFAANLKASVATSFGTPSASNIILPGFTTATQNSGEPLPDPIRVSAGFWVTGLSGKILIQILPSLFINLVIATRAASIWRLVIHACSTAFKPKEPKDTDVPRPELPFCGEDYFLSMKFCNLSRNAERHSSEMSSLNAR